MKGLAISLSILITIILILFILEPSEKPCKHFRVETKGYLDVKSGLFLRGQVAVCVDGK